MSSAAFASPQRDLVLDRYRPLRPLGRGGSGSVWLARDERTGLDVALKIVAREGKRASRAAREAEAASRLRHERCVRAYDFGGDAGHVYIAYEYVQGRTMREALRNGGLTDAETLEAAAQILDGLAHAHGRGIVHRDVKPSNVLVADEAQLSVKLLDFGLAQFDEADTLTAVGDVPGTLAYIAPERLHGQEATAASDVWAVGVLLWEALAGQHPFWGVPLPSVAAAIEAGAPPLQTQRPDLPKRLVAAVTRALAVDPARRPRAAELAAELRSVLSAPREERRRAPRRPRAEAAPARPKPKSAPVALEARLVPAGLAGVVALGGGALLPFWPPVLLVLLAAAAALAAFRWPRAGLAIALFAPLFPLGNVARGAALLYGALALGWLVATWRDARAGLAFAAGPLLAPLGGLAIVPLAVQPARGGWRRALHAGVAVLAAALVAGLAGRPLPLTGDVVGDIGVATSERPADVGTALLEVLSENAALLTTALALALTAFLLPRARARGLWGIAGLGALQLALVLLAAPSVPWPSLVLGTWLLCALLCGTLVLRGAR
ncbi:MAG TPA: serine/threonine-protein kinase [Gaiellaceae bacterium]|nr:serine/threonine-protein kinase [Gaiellaceae bacterium]